LTSCILRWLAEYIQRADVDLTRESFVSRLRSYSHARESLPLLTEKDIDWLFQRTRAYLQKLNGIRKMREDRVPEDLRPCDQLMRSAEEPLRAFYEKVDEFAASSFPFTSRYSREVLQQTRTLIEQFNDDHPEHSIRTDVSLSWVFQILEQCAEGTFPISFQYAPQVLKQTRNRLQRLNRKWSKKLARHRSVISTLKVGPCNRTFTREIEDYLLRGLRRKKQPNGKPLGERTLRSHVNALMGAVKAGAGESASDEKFRERDRIRQQRSKARRLRERLGKKKQGSLPSPSLLTKEQRRRGK
jgi:hypothetical protein